MLPYFCSSNSPNENVQELVKLPTLIEVMNDCSHEKPLRLSGDLNCGSQDEEHCRMCTQFQ